MLTESALSATPVLRGHYTDAAITDKIADIVLTRPAHWGWIAGMAIAAAFTLLFLVAVSYLIAKGVGIWGVNQPVAWGFAITHVVCWIGVGLAGPVRSA